MQSKTPVRNDYSSEHTGSMSQLAARLVALRLTRARFYRDLLIVFGCLPLLIGVLILQELSLSIAPLFAVFGALPLAWFVDLALIGGLNFAFGSVDHALGTLGLLVPTVPVLAAGTTVLLVFFAVTLGLVGGV